MCCVPWIAKLSKITGMSVVISCFCILWTLKYKIIVYEWSTGTSVPHRHIYREIAKPQKVRDQCRWVGQLVSDVCTAPEVKHQHIMDSMITTSKTQVSFSVVSVTWEILLKSCIVTVSTRHAACECMEHVNVLLITVQAVLRDTNITHVDVTMKVNCAALLGKRQWSGIP